MHGHRIMSPFIPIHYIHYTILLYYHVSNQKHMINQYSTHLKIQQACQPIKHTLVSTDVHGIEFMNVILIFSPFVPPSLPKTKETKNKMVVAMRWKQSFMV